MKQNNDRKEKKMSLIRTNNSFIFFTTVAR